MENDELKHYGVPGMKWGVRKQRTIPKASNSHRQSSKNTYETTLKNRSKHKKTASNLRKAAIGISSVSLGGKIVTASIASGVLAIPLSVVPSATALGMSVTAMILSKYADSPLP